LICDSRMKSDNDDALLYSKNALPGGVATKHLNMNIWYVSFSRIQVIYNDR